MIYFPRAVLLALGLVCYSNGFTVVGVTPAFCLTTTTPTTARSTTQIFAEKDEEGEKAAEDVPPPPPAPSGGEDNILNSPAFLLRKLDVIKADIAKAEESIVVAQETLVEGKAEWEKQLDALELEFKNQQERLQSRGNAGNDVAIMNVARSMLEVLDNFDRAFQAVSAETEEEIEIESKYQILYDTVLGIFEELGVKPVPTVGIEFDYEIHQAVLQRPSEDHEEGIVCEELQKGFILNGKTLIRAAMVSVAA